MLGVFLCYNDGDFLRDALAYLLNQEHQLVVWDHGSTDNTAEVIREFRADLVETRRIPREFDFYEIYPSMSRHLMENYISTYDWISWPDQDEILEGPSRVKSYCRWIEEVYESPCNWIQFRNFNFWLTSADNPEVISPIERIRHYSLFPDCAPRIRAWRASVTNIRVFNHNALSGARWPELFNLRHYSMRSREQMMARLMRDRTGLRRGDSNYHYENMRFRMGRLEIPASSLHCDDGVGALNPEPIFNWRLLYGSGPPEAGTQ
ncbi:MAG: glycosyltransferase family 2 protein [Myxococcaceae bacterium]